MPSIVFDTRPLQSDKYVDLAPVNDADQSGIYSEALDFAIENSNIYNIALTGPYGSGKSSIIKTYEKTSDIEILNISLACFQLNSNPDEKLTIDDALIEKSILQQILYAAPSELVPYSRIKRIREPKNIIFNAIAVALWIFFIFLTFMFQEVLYSHNLGYGWLAINSITIAYIIAVPIAFTMDICRFLSVSSFKKISLRNGELEVGDDKNDSHLNKNLDEILYFFNKTKYSLVVFEDLDRFGSPSIFVKLREINSLINSSRKRKIKFLYAIRDDMFPNKERAKFFDFIIPVIPVINNSNSLDKIQERLKAHAFHDDINQQFIREVSLYIDDLRLIQNIFNEFWIYQQHLKCATYNKTKLLAILIYKNIYPSDFEKLHYSKGAFFSICDEKAKIIDETKNIILNEIIPLRAKITESDKETILNVEELVKLYLFSIISNFTQGRIFSIVGNGISYDINSSIDIDKFEKIIGETSLSANYMQQNGYQNQQSIGSSIAIENTAYNGSTYFERKELIINKHHLQRVAIQKNIEELEHKADCIEKSSISYLLSSNREKIASICSDNSISEPDLFVYLVLSGYLEEDYHYYTSSFYEGRLSSKDREYLLLIRNAREPDPNYPIDHPEEVSLNMRDTDFDSIYALNVKLIDHLVQKSIKVKLKAVIKYISNNIEKCEMFFEHYWRNSNSVDRFVQDLTSYWSEYAVVTTRLISSARHIACVIKHCSSESIASKMNIDNKLSIYLSENYSLIYNDNLFSSENFDVLKKLEVKVLLLSNAAETPSLFNYCYNNSLYIINSGNITEIFKFFDFDTSDLQYKNYTEIMESSLQYLKKYIDENISHYVDSVIFSENNCTREKPEYILKMLRSEQLSLTQKQKIINSQEYVFTDISELPENIFQYCFTQGKVQYTWENLLYFYNYNNSDSCPEPIEFMALIQQPMLIENLESLIKPPPSEQLLDFSKQLVICDALDLDLYKNLMKLLPYSWLNYPVNLSMDKKKALCSSGKISFNAESLSLSSNDAELLHIFVNKHINEFKKTNNIPLYKDNIDVVVEVLKSLPDISHKIVLIENLSMDILSQSKDIIDLAAQVFIKCKSELNTIDDSIIDFVTYNTSDINSAISILLNIISSSSTDRIKNILSKLPEPYNEINNPNVVINFESTNENTQLINALKKAKLISSSRKNMKNIRVETLP